mmetsp:Transcript_41359/g.109037  ORF Transcript_41359/g.109037 Transcript_41359/m.109037 type:complete len:264 (+) Transcript_41359:713-1504(+)
MSSGAEAKAALLSMPAAEVPSCTSPPVLGSEPATGNGNGMEIVEGKAPRYPGGGRTACTPPPEAAAWNPSVPAFPTKHALWYPSVCPSCPPDEQKLFVFFWNEGIDDGRQVQVSEPAELKTSCSDEGAKIDEDSSVGLNAFKRSTSGRAVGGGSTSVVETQPSFPSTPIKASIPKDDPGVARKPTTEPDELKTSFPKEGVGVGRRLSSMSDEFKVWFEEVVGCGRQSTAAESDEGKTSCSEGSGEVDEESSTEPVEVKSLPSG